MASGFGVYGRLSVLRSGGPLSRWLARYIGFAVGVFLFGAVFMIGGHADVFGSSQDVTLSWPLLALLAAIVGLLWATFAGIMR